VTKMIMFLCVFLAISVSKATAENGFLSSMKARYSIPDGSKLDDCNTCHDGHWSRNVYGQDLEAAGAKNNLTAAFDATDAVDSDGDGPNNQMELTAGTWPGDPGDIAPVEESTWGRIKALFD
jgi:hypothetical protein